MVLCSKTTEEMWVSNTVTSYWSQSEIIPVLGSVVGACGPSRSQRNCFLKRTSLNSLSASSTSEHTPVVDLGCSSFLGVAGNKKVDLEMRKLVGGATGS